MIVLPTPGSRPPTPAAGYVLVGGKSSRFASDKALYPWPLSPARPLAPSSSRPLAPSPPRPLSPSPSRPLALHVADQVRAAAGSVTLVGNPEKYAHLGLPVISDLIPNHGPLAGLAAALDHTSSAWNLVVACDMPHLTPDFLAYLCDMAPALSAQILLPIDHQGRPEPLCAVYHKSCHMAIADAIRQGIHKMTDAFASLRVRRLEPSEYAAFDPRGRLFANLNTPAAANV